MRSPARASCTVVTRNSFAAQGGFVKKNGIDLGEAPTLARAHSGTTVKEDAVNRALRVTETDDLADWIQAVGKRLAEVDPRKNAWRTWPDSEALPSASERG